MVIFKTRRAHYNADSPNSWRLRAHIAVGDVILTDECGSAREVIKAANKLIRQLEAVKRAAQREEWGGQATLKRRIPTQTV